MNLHDYQTAAPALVPVTANQLDEPAATPGRPRLVMAAIHDPAGNHVHDLLLTVRPGARAHVEATCAGRRLRLTVRLDVAADQRVALDASCDLQVGIWRRRARAYASAGAAVTLRCDDGLELRVRVR